MIGYDTIIITCDEKFIEYLCTSKDWLTKSNDYDAFRLWLNDGLLLSTGKKWFKRRRLLTPSFHFNILEDFISIFNNCSDILIDKLKKEIDNDSIDLHPFVTLCSLDAIYGKKKNLSRKANYLIVTLFYIC